MPRQALLEQISETGALDLEVRGRIETSLAKAVENALDAAAQSVAVTLEQGGKRLIRIEDDGSQTAFPQCAG